jgi:hypothetical protein
MALGDAARCDRQPGPVGLVDARLEQPETGLVIVEAQVANARLYLS